MADMSALEKYSRQRRADAIADGKDLNKKEFRSDGYTNMLNKYGTSQDNSRSYTYYPEKIEMDLELTRLYEGNGLFAKIIDRPSEEAVKNGFDIDFGDEDITEYVEEKLDDLDYEDKFATAEKWARLYGGAIIVMLIDDGRGLEEPVDWDAATKISEMRVFERAVVEPDYSTLYTFNFEDSINKGIAFAEPEFYQVYSTYGNFRVHRTRCLVFRNGRLPEKTMDSRYRYWGIPEYIRIREALREVSTAHEDGVKILERSAQAIYKMKNLASMLSTDQGEDQVVRRLQAIDMARDILNSIAIDTDGEDYDFKQLTMSGVKDVLDSTCTMLSAVSEIPQTVLFGRSPAGENATGEADMENYYNLIERIQKQNMKRNSRIVINMILKEGHAEGIITEIPKYKVRFASLKTMNDTDRANYEKTVADTEFVRAQTHQIYLQNQVEDISEVRENLKDNENFDITDEPDDDDLFSNMPQAIQPTPEEIAIANELNQPDEHNDSENEPLGSASVIVIKDGKVLVGARRNSEGYCSPGGHIEDGETPEEAAERESQEEFGIVPLDLIPIGREERSSPEYCNNMLYLCDNFTGTAECDGDEMMTTEWHTIPELLEMDLFPPFREGIEMMLDTLGLDGDSP